MKSKIGPVIVIILALVGIAIIAPTPPGGRTVVEEHPEQTPAENFLQGHYEGSIQVLGTDIPVRADFSEANATMDIPIQGVMGMPLGNVSFDDPDVHFEITETGAVFDGELKGDEISGQLRQSGIVGSFYLKRTEKAVIVEEPLPYRQEDVSFKNGDITLAGTLTLPEGEGPFPAIVLISGSGPQNRDEEIYEFKIFRTIADNLTRSGIAVLRYDDRGVGGSTGDIFNSTSGDFAKDVEAAVGLLKSRPDIGSIGLLGHSEGGLIAPMVAADTKDVDFIILMAGPAVNGKEILLAQSELILRAENASEEVIQQQRDLQGRILQAAETGEGWEEIEADMRKIVRESIEELPEEQKKTITDVEALVDARVDPQIAFEKSPWFKFFLEYEPSVGLKKTEVPVLALFGELDLQVPADMNKVAMEKLLENNTDVTIIVLPKANHLFQEAITGSINEYPFLKKEFVPGFLDTITEWVLERS